MSVHPPTSRRATRFIERASIPRTPQLAFLVPVVSLELLLAATNPEEILTLPFLEGIALVLLATAATLWVPWHRLPPQMMASIALLDIAALGALHLVPSAASVAALVVIPAMWLGASHRATGVVLATLGSLMAFAGPTLLGAATSLDGTSRAVLMPIVALVTSASMAMVAEVWAAQRHRLEEQGQELAQALDQVRGHRRLTDAILESVDVGILALGPHGEYESMNPKHREFLALAYPDGHDGVAGQQGAVRAADNVSEIPIDEMPSVRATRGEAFHDYTIWIGADPDQALAVSVSAQPMFDAAGTFSGAVLAYHDVTELMRALRVKDDFVAAVSHELRTPLTSIMGYLDLAGDHGDELPDEVRHYLEVASRNADRLLLLVSDLLTAAQAEGTSMRVAPYVTDVSAVVRQSVEDMGQRAAAGGLTLESDIPELPAVVMDADRIRQVVDNLLSNAVKHTLPGGTVAVSLERLDVNVVITVRDDGIGIPTAEQDGLFTKFFRAQNVTDRAIPGIGLGLVITKAIVDAHGGDIAFVSEEGVGTTVRVTLPFVAPEQPEETEAPEEPVALRPVEDDPPWPVLGERLADGA